MHGVQQGFCTTMRGCEHQLFYYLDVAIHSKRFGKRLLIVDMKLFDIIRRWDSDWTHTGRCRSYVTC